MSILCKCEWSVIGSAIAILCGFVALIFSIRHEKIDARRIRVLESFILIATVLFLAHGTRETVLKLIERNTIPQGAFSADENKAVLQAYKQLSEELNRWFVMFVVLGSFFGIVLPIGSYLLQIKAVSQKESESEDRLKEAENRNQGTIASAREQIQKDMERIRTEVSKDVQRLWRSQVIMAHGNFKSAIYDLEEEGWVFSKERRRELLTSLLLVLKYLAITNDQAFIAGRVKMLADEITKVSQKTVDVDGDTWTRGLRKQTSDRRINLLDYCKDCADEFSKISKFLEKFGILVLS